MPPLIRPHTDPDLLLLRYADGHEGTLDRREAAQLAIRVSPELAEAIRQAAASHPGGVSGWLADAARAHLAPDAREDAEVHSGLADLLRSAPVLLLPDRGDVIVRVLREPVPVCGVLAEGAGPGIAEALAGLRRAAK